jgi:MFS family permease
MTVTQARRSRAAGLANSWRSGPLGAPGFRLLTFGQFTSTIGDYCYAVALPWLVLSGGGSAASLGIVLACYGIPRALLTVPGGSLTDRFSPRLVMLTADFGRRALTAAFAVLAATHVSSLAALAPVAVLLGSFSALFMPASMAMMPSLVDPSRLTVANSIYAGFVQAGSILGPVIGGVLVATTAAADAAPASVWELLRQSRVLQIILVVVLSANFALVGTTEVALPALAHARFGAGGYGAVLTCIAVAALVGALVVGKVGDRFRPVTLIAGSLIVGAAAIAAAPFLGGLPGVAAGLAVFGIATGFDNVVSVTLIQRWAPPAMLGRVWGLLTLASVGSFPVATFVAGLLVRHLGPTLIFPISGALLALSMAYGLAQREFRDFGIEDGIEDKERLSADKGLSQAGA